MTRIVLGIDIGGTNTALGFFDRDGACLAETTLPTQAHQPPDVFFPRLHASISDLWRSLGTPTIAGIGLGAPDANQRKGTIENPPNLCWRFVDAHREMSDRWKVPVAVTNDANAAALGEQLYGAARGMRDFLVITLGTGLGSGIIVNGELVLGASGHAGEIGHTNVEPDGRPCGCGLRGCLETYVSAPGLVKTTLNLLKARSKASNLRSVPEKDLSASTISKAALEGDSIALEAFDHTGAILGRKLADSVAHTSPEAIFLFGGLARAGELIFAPTRNALEENLFHTFRGTVKLLPSGVLQDRAATLGAAALIWKELNPAPGPSDR